VTLICAHRGASATLPDNSLAAFTAAIEMGADMIETDVRRAPGGRLVLSHDPLAPGDDGSALVGLEALVALAAGRIALDLELKEDGCEEAVLRLVEPRPPGLVLTSFRPGLVASLRRLDPSLRLGLLLDEGETGDLLGRALACGADVAAPHRSLVGPALRQAAVAAGRPLWVWTVNAPDELAALLGDPAIACVITDHPDRARAAACEGQGRGRPTRPASC